MRGQGPKNADGRSKDVVSCFGHRRFSHLRRHDSRAVVISPTGTRFAPFALSYYPGSAPYANDLVIGAIVVALAGARLLGAYRSA